MNGIECRGDACSDHKTRVARQKIMIELFPETKDSYIYKYYFSTTYLLINFALSISL